MGVPTRGIHGIHVLISIVIAGNGMTPELRASNITCSSPDNLAANAACSAS